MSNCRIYNYDISKRQRVEQPVPNNMPISKITNKNILLDPLDNCKMMAKFLEDKKWFQVEATLDIVKEFSGCSIVFGTGVLEDVIRMPTNPRETCFVVRKMTTTDGNSLALVTSNFNDYGVSVTPEIDAVRFSGYVGREFVNGQSKNMQWVITDKLKVGKMSVGTMSNLICVKEDGFWKNEEDRIAVKCTVSMKPYKLVEYYLHCKANRFGRLLLCIRDHDGMIQSVEVQKLADFERRHSRIIGDKWQDAMKFLEFFTNQISELEIGPHGTEIGFTDVEWNELKFCKPSQRLYISQLGAPPSEATEQLTLLLEKSKLIHDINESPTSVGSTKASPSNYNSP